MSNKVKINEIAKELSVNFKEVIQKANELGIKVQKYTDTVSESEAGRVFEAIRNSRSSNTNRSDSKNTKKVSQKSNIKRRPQNRSKAEERDEQNVSKERHKNSSEASSQDRPQQKRRSEKENRPLTKRPPKQKGLKIVKKKRPLKSATLDRGSYGKLSDEAKKEITAKKSSSKKSGSSAIKRQQGEALDIFNDRDFTNNNRYSTSLNDEEEVILFDYRDQQLLDEREEEDRDFKKKSKEKKSTGAKKGPKRHGGNNRQSLVRSVKKRKRKVRNDEEEIVTEAEIPENVRVYEFAEIIKKPLAEVIKVLFNMGMMVTKNDFLEGDVIEVLADEFEVEVTTIDITAEFDYVKQYEEVEEKDDDLVTRAPVITIMGHVDHGKTSLLDKIRNAKVADGEAGGITQHVGAYTIQHNDNPITFIDTPGHSAFTEMRKRGAKITDVVIIVVAADDGVKPQTREAIKHAQEAGVPILVAVNKMDKEGANPEMVKAQVAELGLNPVEWGGDTEFIPLSAKTGEGIDDLLENILIQAEVLELSANPDRNGKATVVESSLEKGRGSVATVIVSNGTVRVGDSIVVGSYYGKVKSILNDMKKPIKAIAPGETGVVVGLNGVPASGEDLVVTDSEKEARELAEKRGQYERNQALSKTTKASLDELGSMIAEGRMEVLKIILKTDVHGTLEAIKSLLQELRNDEVKVSIISEGVGGITENDVILAGDSENIMIVGFNVRPTGSIKNLAEKNNVKLKTYSVIYEIVDDVTNILSGMMKPIEEEEDTGQAEIRQLFKVKEGVVAGCLVVDGAVEKNIFVRLIRDGVVIANTTIHSLKRFKDEVNEVKKGYECGILLKDLNDIAEGDIIETYRKVTKQASL